MPETPDFDKIARDALERWGINDGWSTATVRHITGDFAAELRQVWNARGAADLMLLKAELADFIFVTDTSERVDRALRTLDR